MDRREFLELIDKYLAGEATQEEEAVLLEFYETYGTSETTAEDEKSIDDQELKILNVIRARIEVRPRRYWWRPWAAAILLLGVSLSLWHIKRDDAVTSVQKNISSPNDVNPGGNRATLKLADGRSIFLDEIEIGQTFENGNFIVEKTDDGELNYRLHPKANIGTDESPTNTIETPNGGQYTVVLPDGSKVLLNAASSLSYSLNFSKKRHVRLSGEAYFEVSPKTIPFTVETNEQLINVLGTHFNVSSYGNDKTYTTLVEGKVAVKARWAEQSKEIVLEPKMEVISDHKKNEFRKQPANIESRIAWKNGEFIFQDRKLEEIMRAIERWYNIKVDYNSLPNARYTVIISRKVKLSSVLEMLETTGDLKFQLIDNTLFIK